MILTLPAPVVCERENVRMCVRVCMCVSVYVCECVCGR